MGAVQSPPPAFFQATGHELKFLRQGAAHGQPARHFQANSFQGGKPVHARLQTEDSPLFGTRTSPQAPPPSTILDNRLVEYMNPSEADVNALKYAPNSEVAQRLHCGKQTYNQRNPFAESEELEPTRGAALSNTAPLAIMLTCPQVSLSFLPA